MIISKVSGSWMRRERSSMAGSSSKISVRTHRNTFSKFLLKNWATITRITEKRSRKYTVATIGFSRMA